MREQPLIHDEVERCVPESRASTIKAQHVYIIWHIAITAISKRSSRSNNSGSSSSINNSLSSVQRHLSTIGDRWRQPKPTFICVNMNIPEYYDYVSLRLTEVLDASGLKEDIRWRRINTFLQTEELEQICVEKTLGVDFKLYYFGSQAEATTTPGLSSDIDKVICMPGCAAPPDPQFWISTLDSKADLLMVADESTPPGYVKLQIVHGDPPMTVTNFQNKIFLLDIKCRTVLSNRLDYSLKAMSFDHHGPAQRIFMLGGSFDTVPAIRSLCLYEQVSRRMSSIRRNYNWPTRQLIDAIKKTAVLLVPVGQKLSPEQHLEWRLSFSFGEKLLMMQFNSTQYKCYVMLKFINHTFINVDEVLTSYHCKTCMFYLIEDTPASLWHPNNLMLCMDLCLKKLLSWVQCANCPNYFIPEENMFLGRLVGPVQRQIASILQDLLARNGWFIKEISYDSIGKNVDRMCQSLGMELDCPDENICIPTMSHLGNRLHVLCSLSANFSKCLLFKTRYGPRQEIGSVVRSLMCSTFGIHVASQSLMQEIPSQEELNMAHELLLWGSSSDVASGNLKLATFYLVQGKFDIMEEVLNQVGAKLTHNVCEHGDICLKKSTLSKILHENLSTENIIQNCFAFIVYYSLLDIHSIPKVLIFEIFRSTGSELSPDMVRSKCLPNAEVRARVYLYFLQYQCFHLQGRIAQKLVALCNIICLSNAYCTQLLEIMQDMSIADVSDILHPEMSAWLGYVTTALNLMAYCLKQDGRLMDAFNVLCVSMKLRYQHNAAKWQIATFINVAISILSAKH
ncbi:hypothetical protein CHS0354_006772 [Potamilus streckersoni]|uniref:Mab-21-like HhH/H2TH-like domain-containing protein n=1 Tax=Potamilus streckersoni TaxID=2493646 RepID=A0AAE0VR45_9BIVA|nr:hypothetical protein CHS0354_006772 [Potamilus streckersoni]